ncbi:MAG: Tn3 family transposase [Burkholderiales bacterium]|nr:Tn3 family transposase [Burkholderiales bacterium]
MDTLTAASCDEIIHYNSTILSKLCDKYEVEGNKKALDKLKKVIPIAWQHIHFLGHLTFTQENNIDLDKIIQGLVLHG